MSKPKSNTAQKVLAFCAVLTLIVLLSKQCYSNRVQEIVIKDEGLQEKVDKQAEEIKELKSVTDKLLELTEITPTEQIKRIERKDIFSKIEDSNLKTKIELSENTPIGIYKLDPSFTQAFSLIINNSIANGISPNDVFVEITGTADMMKITNLPYHGEFGKINEVYEQEDSSFVQIKLDEGKSIYKNSDLAFLRAYSLKKQLEKTAKLNPENIKINVRTVNEIGSEFRNTTVKMSIKGI